MDVLGTSSVPDWPPNSAFPLLATVVLRRVSDSVWVYISLHIAIGDFAVLMQRGRRGGA